MAARMELSDEQIMFMRSDYAAGLSQREIGDKLGINKAVVRRYVQDIPSKRAGRKRYIFKCAGCPMLFYSARRGRTYCKQECQTNQIAREKQYRLAEFKWIVGTDSPENVAIRLGYGNAKNLARFLFRCGEDEWARKFEHVAMPQERVRAA